MVRSIVAALGLIVAATAHAEPFFVRSLADFEALPVVPGEEFVVTFDGFLLELAGSFADDTAVVRGCLSDEPCGVAGRHPFPAYDPATTVEVPLRNDVHWNVQLLWHAGVAKGGDLDELDDGQQQNTNDADDGEWQELMQFFGEDVTPERFQADVNYDGHVDYGDVNLVLANVNTPLRYQWNGVSLLLILTTDKSPVSVNPIVGDAATFEGKVFDGKVDVNDLNAVRNHFGAAVVDPEKGLITTADTFPLDGMVNIDDLNRVRNHFGPSREMSAVPEPTTAALLALGLYWCFGGSIMCRRRLSSP